VPSEQLRFVLETIGSLAGIAALVAIALELQRARRADTREFMSRAYEKYTNLIKERDSLASIEYSSIEELILRPDAEAEYAAFEKTSFFWTELTTEVKHNPSEKKIAIEEFGRLFYGFYEKWSPYLNDLHEIEGEGGYHWTTHMDWFASEYKRILPGDWDARNRLVEYYAKLKTQTS